MPLDSDTPTTPSPQSCDHRDLAGDSLIEAKGDLRWCTSCGANWRDKEIVIVNDEVNEFDQMTTFSLGYALRIEPEPLMFGPLFPVVDDDEIT